MKWIGQHIYDLIARFRADIYIEKGLRDKDGDIGTSGQILSSTGTQTNWINAPSVGTLQTVTDNGNTTTNSIMIGSSSNIPCLMFQHLYRLCIPYKQGPNVFIKSLFC